MSTPARKVWIDLTNSPHVLFFRPVIRRLDEAGVATVVTARDFAQTLGLLERYDIPHTVIGKHGGASVSGKALGLVRRSGSMIRFGRGQGITQSVSHGSNDLAIAARTLRIHSTVIHDYEGAAGMHRINFRLASKVMMPDVIPYSALVRLRPRRGALPAVSRAQGAGRPGRLRTRRLGLRGAWSRPRAAHRGVAPAGHHEPVPPRHREHGLR